MNIGERIRDARREIGLTQSELAAKVNLSRSHIGSIERNRYNPSLSTLTVIGEALQKPLSYFTDGQELPSRPVKEPAAPTRKHPRRLQELIDEEIFTLNGEIATPEDKEKIMRVIEALYYDAKIKNKRRKGAKLPS